MLFETLKTYELKGERTRRQTNIPKKHIVNL
jgi:hypothetical protein